MPFFYFVVLCICGIPYWLEAQEGVSQQLEDLAIDDAQALEDYGENLLALHQYRIQPLDLNTCTEQDLALFPFLSTLQIQAFLWYRKRLRTIYSLYELQNIPTFTPALVQQLLPYVQVAGKKTLRYRPLSDQLQYGRYNLLARYQRVLEKTNAYRQSKPHYFGDPARVYLRLQYQYYDRLQWGLSLEKDPGEALFARARPQQQGFDYIGFHYFMRHPTQRIKFLALGDYRLFLGQGLLAWSSNMRARTSSIKNAAHPIRPYAGAQEQLALRGAAISHILDKKERWLATHFVSRRRIDARLTERDSQTYIYTLQSTGYHRTPSEWETRNNATHYQLGSALNMKGAHYHIGIQGIIHHWSLPIYAKTPNDFQGQWLYNSSIDYGYLFKHWQFFGEVARSPKDWASTQGLLYKAGSKLQCSFLHRYFGKRYHSAQAQGFGGKTQGESGAYLRIDWSPLPKISGMHYLDYSQTLTPNTPAKIRFFARWNYSLSYGYSAYLQYQYLQSQNTRHNIRLHWRYPLSSTWTWQQRLAWSYIPLTRRSGYLLYQDIMYQPPESPLRFQMRWALFHVEEYDARLYAYENDVLYAFSVPAYFGKGSRFYLNLRYRLRRRCTLYLRYAFTHFVDRDQVGTGIDAIDAPRKSEVKIQFQLKW